MSRHRLSFRPGARSRRTARAAGLRQPRHHHGQSPWRSGSMPALPAHRRQSAASRISAALGAAVLVLSVVPAAIGVPVLGSSATPRAAGAAALTSHTPAPTSVTIAGSLQSEIGCPGDWQADCAASHLAFDADDDVWQGSFALPAGSYEYKAPLNDAWDENYGLHAEANGAKVTFRYVTATQVLTVSAGHGHDGNVEWDGLRHDSRDTTYRTPGGAVPAGTPVTIRLRTFHDDVTGVSLRVYSLNTAGQSVKKMSIATASVSCAEPALATERCDFWSATLPDAAPDNLWYRFIVTDGTDTDYYADDTPALDGGLGAPT